MPVALSFLAITSQYSAVLVGLTSHVTATEYTSITSSGLEIRDVVLVIELATVTYTETIIQTIWYKHNEENRVNRPQVQWCS